ncbi:MAG: type II secretion system protein [Gemmatimonadaceae bacterium]
MTPNARSLRRAGRTLAELMVALMVSGVLFVLLATAFIGHERLVSGSTAIGEARAQARQAHQIVPALLRSVVPADVYAMHDTLADFAYPISSSLVCLLSTSNQLMLAPDSSARGQIFVSRTHTPTPGDLAHIFDSGVLPSTTDDRWWLASVSGLATLPNGCSGSPLLDPVADAVHSARVLSVAWLGGAPVSIPPGAVVHFTRRTRALLYASSGNDYLGISNFDPVRGWSVVQPVSGPYARLSSAPGVRFQLLDSLGGALPSGAPALGASTLALHVRTQTAVQVRVAGMQRGARSESLSAHVALRNR